MQERKAKKKIVYSRKAKETRLAAGGLVLRFPVEIPSRWGLGGEKKDLVFFFRSTVRLSLLCGGWKNASADARRFLFISVM